MYAPPQFQQHDPAELIGLISAYPFSTLISTSSAGVEANHIPLLWRDDGSSLGVLSGHIARANLLWQQHDLDTDVLAVFHGPDAYISPSWYFSNREHGKVIPTWNYAAVHAYGRLQVIEYGGLISHLAELTRRMESSMSEPWDLNDAPVEFIQSLLDRIVGIEISIGRLMGKWKMSQNQPLADQQGVIAGLRNSGQTDAAAVAYLVQRYLKPGA
jgi:transcriptional regulator